MLCAWSSWIICVFILCDFILLKREHLDLEQMKSKLLKLFRTSSIK